MEKSYLQKKVLQPESGVRIVNSQRKQRFLLRAYFSFRLIATLRIMLVEMC